VVSGFCSGNPRLSREDIASAGTIGLINAAAGWSTDKDVPFTVYARGRIQTACIDEIRAMDWTTRRAHQRIKEARAVTETLAAQLHRNPTVNELASAMGVDYATASKALVEESRTVSYLDAALEESLIADSLSPEQVALETERNTFLKTAVNALPERMRYIVEQVYFEDRSVAELAEEFGSTHAAVSQQRSEAIRLLQDSHASCYEGRTEPTRSRISGKRHDAYMSTVRQHTAGGLTRPVHRVPALAGAA
jgi:RNA polymerase sigma factor for flagellar operon FliA